MISLKPITEKSWLVLSDTDKNRVGLLTEIRNQYILMISGAKQNFLSRKDVNKFFNEDVFSNITESIPEDATTTTTKSYFINGYPVDFPTPSEVLIAGCKLPLFSKKPTSDVYYSAGFFCLEFPRNTMPAYCPKLSTLNTYKYAGPFATELEMKTELAKLRKLRNNKI